MKYEPSLDGLRAIAVVFVVLFHCSPTHFRGGWLGVEIFFVLSGYLITTILAGEIELTGSISFKRFYVRRILRLGPAVVCLYIFQGLRAVWSAHRVEIATATAVSLFNFMNWNRAFDLLPIDVLGHTWSLSMEEQFYLLWPFTLGLIIRNRPRSWLLGAILLVLAWRCWLNIEGATAERTYNGFDTHSDPLLIGCLLAFAPHAIKQAGSKLAVLALLALTCCAFLLPYDAAGVQSVGLTVMALLSACVVCGALSNAILRRLLASPLLVFTGKISYGWYLWHYPLILLATLYGGSRLTVWASAILSYVVAIASYYLVERPFLRLKAHLHAPASPGPVDLRPVSPLSN